jgi:predicted negative regulator of RcsB-dependent stress response
MATAHAQRRMTKHELKEDAFLNVIISSREWVLNNLQKTLIVGVGILVLIAAVWGFFAWRSSQEAEAQKLFGQGGVEMRSNNPPAAIAQFQKLMDEHSGSSVAGIGCFQLAQMQFRQRTFDDARVNYQRYIDSYGDDPMLVAASWAGLGAVDEQAGFYAEATEKFTKAVDADKSGFSAAEYLRRAIRTAVDANNSALALELFARLQKDYVTDPASINTAKQHLIERGVLDPNTL